MAVTAEILLLVALISNNIQAEIIQLAGESHTVILDKTADFCLISRWSGEEKKLLWNSSELHDSSLEREVSYDISSLDDFDSGQYQEQCWTQGNVTHERNSTILVCDDQKTRYQNFDMDVGQTVELTCDAAGPNQSVQWFIESQNHKTKNWELALIEDETSSVHKLQLVKNKSSLLVTVDKSSDDTTYFCLEKNHQRCEVLRQVVVYVEPESIHRSVGESLELNCSDIGGNQPLVWSMDNSVMDDEVSHNYTLMFPSLTLNHTGQYTCEFTDLYHEFYHLYVCPESDPPAVAFFTGGENVTLQCGDWPQPDEIVWFMRTNRTEGRVSHVRSDTSLVVANVSLDDSGEFWCVIMEDRHCVFTSKTLVMFGEPEVEHHLVRSVVLNVVIIMMMCVVVATAWRTRSREQLPVPAEYLEMSDLSTVEL